MKTADTRVFSIIVKIWIESAGQPNWHGRVTHIPSGEEHYVRRVEDIALIISRYLAGFGFRPGLCLRVRQWLRQPKW